jgi:hypothetical protein
MKDELIQREIIELWHTARIAGHTSRYDRMQYCLVWLAKKYPELRSKQLWLAIEEAIS